MSIADYRKMKSRYFPSGRRQLAESRRIERTRIATGRTDAFDWAIIPVRTTRHFQSGLQERSCAVWLVFWDETDWFAEYAGQPATHPMMVKAVPDLSDVPLDALPDCGLPPEGEAA